MSKRSSSLLAVGQDFNMSDFRDVSRSNSWDYSAFVRTYALYLDDRLDLRMQARHGKRGVYCVGGDTVDDKQDKPEADLQGYSG
ncbi:hypothetical protein Bca52824_079744 [Brassica carinata]|uniref:ENTH domain-containing protein n=1 Tax=Brassica carinata TaxID=52824 RepID=A0A8X7PZ42_BRACI|nr:hypothetical protein Bca52824_079744 [Brassica carinata]